MASTPIAVVTSDGTTVRVDQGHRAMTIDAIDAAEAYAVKSGTHLWIAAVSYKLSPEALDRMETEPLHFDAENLLSTGIGCYICEQPWESALTSRRCPGEPS